MYRFHFRCIGLDEASAAVIEAYCCDICREMGVGTTRSKSFSRAQVPSSSSAGCWQSAPPTQEPPRADLALQLLQAVAGGFAFASQLLPAEDHRRLWDSVDVLAGHRVGVPSHHFGPQRPSWKLGARSRRKRAVLSHLSSSFPSSSKSETRRSCLNEITCSSCDHLGSCCPREEAELSVEGTPWRRD